jgi:tripartite-type tricarboxylate transporter receptor subunit TctC
MREWHRTGKQADKYAGVERNVTSRRLLLLGAASLIAGPVRAQTYPTRLIRLIAPYPPGGATDIVARLTAAAIGLNVRQTVLVDNRAGAGGLIGHELGAKAAPDGYTLLLGNSAMLAVSVSLYPQLPYNPITDFTPISLIAKGGLVLLVNPRVPAHNLTELVGFAKSRPGELNAGIASLGSIHHLLTETLKANTHAEWANVPYKGSAPMLLDLIAGQLDLAFDNISSALPYVRSGQLRALAVTSAERTSLLPETPTLRESGLPIDGVSWHGILGPAGLPRDVVDVIHRSVVNMIQDTQNRARLAALGLDPVGSTPEEFAAFIAAENLRWAQIAKQSGARME